MIFKQLKFLSVVLKMLKMVTISLNVNIKGKPGKVK